MGRPTIFTPELAERLCQLIAEGRSLRRACRVEGMPDKETVRRWLGTQDEPVQLEDGSLKAGPYTVFRAHYARACELRGEARNDEIDDYKAKLIGKKIDPMTARVLIDATKWQASKEAPKKYAEAMILRGDKENPVEARKVVSLDDAALAAIAAGGLRAAD